MMPGKHRLLLLIAVMTVVAVVSTGIAITILYRTAFNEERDRLLDTVRSRARLMEAVARFNQTHADQIRDEDPAYSPREATISQIREGHENFEGFGQTGEFTLAELQGDQIVFRLNQRHPGEGVSPAPVPVEPTLAEPMRRALRGESGWLVGLDYRGATVLAAYEPVDVLDLGVVAKIDLAEVREPFIRVGIIAAIAMLALVLAGAALVYRIGTPLITALEKREKYYRSLLYTLHEDILVVDRDYRIVDLNNTMLKTTGLRREQVIGRHCYEVSHNFAGPCDEFGEDCAFKKVLETGEPTNCHHVHARADGSLVHVDILMSPMLDSAGNVTHVIEAIRDITDVFAAQEAVAQSEQKFRELYSSMVEGICQHELVFDAEGQAVDYRILDVNPAYETITGLTREQVVGRLGSEAYGVAPPPYLEVFARVTISGIPETLETYFPPMDKHFHISVVSPDQRRFNTIFLDISDRIQAEQALCVSEERYRLAQRITQVGVWDWDIESNTLYWSPEIERMFGYAPGGFGGTVEEIVAHTHPDDLAAWQESVRACLEDGVEHDLEFRIVREDGEVRWISALGDTTRDEEGKAVRMLGLVMDITERKNAEQALRESEGKLREAQDMARLGYWHWDVNTGEVEWSDEVFRIFHLDPAEFTPQIESIMALSTSWPEDSQRHRELIEKATKSHERGAFEQRFLRPDGSVGHYHSTFQGVYDDAGDLTALRGTVQDITERKRAEEAVSESALQFRTVWESSGDGMRIVDEHGIT